MRTAIIFLQLFLLPISLSAQDVKGYIKHKEGWQNKVYLIEVSSFDKLFSGVNENVTDTFEIASDGHFSSQALKENTLYRLNVVPENAEAGYLIQTGSVNNYAFFVTLDSGTVVFNGDMESFYETYSIKSENQALDHLQQKVLAIRSVKKPVYDFFKKMQTEIENINKDDTSAIAHFKTEAISRTMVINDATNKELRNYIKEGEHPLVVSLALINYGFQFALEDPVVLSSTKILSSHWSYPLVASILNHINTYNAVALDQFLYKPYPLIDTGVIVLNSLNSDYILLDFWASWCLPCRDAIKTVLNSLHHEFSRETLQIVGIAVDDNKKHAEDAIVKDRNHFIQIYEEGGYGSLYNLFRVQSLPFYVLINKHTGEIRISQMAELIFDLITE